MSARYFGAAVPRLEDPAAARRPGPLSSTTLHPAGHAARRFRALAGRACAHLAASTPQRRAPCRASRRSTRWAISPRIAAGPMPPMAPHPLLKTPLTYHPLAVDEVRHVGEAIAIVLAESRGSAEDAAAAVDARHRDTCPRSRIAVAALEPGAPAERIPAATATSPPR